MWKKDIKLVGQEDRGLLFHPERARSLSERRCWSGASSLSSFLRDELDPQGRGLTQRMAFSAAYHMSPGPSVVVTAIQRA